MQSGNASAHDVRRYATARRFHFGQFGHTRGALDVGGGFEASGNFRLETRLLRRRI